MRKPLDIHLLVGLSGTRFMAGVGHFQATAEELGHHVMILEEELSYYARANIQAIITPGNSYGHMTGGLDKAVVELVGPWVEQQVRDSIQNEYCGELNVGDAFMVTNFRSKFPHVVYAPTMRSPTHLPHGNEIAYLSTLAALQVINRFNNRNPDRAITRILMPLMCVGTGMVPPETVLKQQALALRRYSDKRPIEHLFKDGKHMDAELGKTWPSRFA